MKNEKNKSQAKGPSVLVRAGPCTGSSLTLLALLLRLEFPHLLQEGAQRGQAAGVDAPFANVADVLLQPSAGGSGPSTSQSRMGGRPSTPNATVHSGHRRADWIRTRLVPARNVTPLAVSNLLFM